jgi:uncharacterized membrane protein YjgN (DUF898 family)
MSVETTNTQFVGEKGELFVLSLKTAFLTVITLGGYRFWMKTRLRRYYWSSVRPGGFPLEYMGQPIEKLLGFLIAVVFLAFYIGLVNLGLMYVSFTYLETNIFAYAMSFIGVVPIWFYALYRARRYILARTRWRGLRFALDPGAWGYAIRALFHWLLTIVTLGLLWPRMTYKLEKFRTDRTWYGNVKLAQGGKWTMLYGSTKHLFIGLFLSLAAGFAAYMGTWDALWVLLLSVPWFLAGLAYYRVDSFRRMTNTKEAGEVRFTSDARTGRIIRIYVLGHLKVIFVIFGVMFLIGVVIAIALGGRDLEQMVFSGAAPAWLLTLVGVITYFFFFLGWGVLKEIWVNQPKWQHYAETLEIKNLDNVALVQQREDDSFDQAEGFAEALDLGASI